MKRKLKRLLAAFMVLALVNSISYAASRTWKSSNGRFSVEAELLDYKDGKAQLKKNDGTVIDVPLASLCEEDRRYVKNQFPGAEEEKLAPGVEYRQWKSKNGKFSTTAEFLGCTNGKVQLRKPDGTEISVDKNGLSAADQRWVAERSQEEEKEGKSSDTGGGEEIAGRIDEQEIPMKLVRLDLPKPKARGKSASPPYLFSQVNPQQIYVKLGQGDDARDAAFHRAVTKEPSYTATTPVRGVARFGKREYGFAIDSAGKGAFNRLYFDVNGNGDLTDDKPITATMSNSPIAGLAQSQFPRADITLDAGGKSIEYAFVPSVICRTSGGDAYATVTLYAAAVREGFITRGAKRTSFVLVDHNSNGLFDDAASVRPDGNVVEGDLLLINPKAKQRLSADADVGRDRNFVNKTVCLSGEFYRLEIPPSGDVVKLTPTKFSMGYVVNSSPAYRAVLFSEDYGVVTIFGAKDQKLYMPEGSWKVLSYAIGMGRTLMTATFGKDACSTTVTKGQTSQLPFGAPLHSVVTSVRSGADKVWLSLSIVGIGGERCTSLTINGNRPPKPQFVIKDKDGKIVHKGSFEWG
jgi:hypothetical protein